MNEFWKKLFSWSKEVLIAIAIVIVFSVFFILSTVYNVSMNPTLKEGDILLLVKRAELKRGDIVSFRSIYKITEKDVKELNFLQRIFNKAGDSKNFVKRVIGLPGDLLEIRDGKVYINGEELQEPYVSSPINTGDVPEQRVPENAYFLMGDNRAQSLDSRAFGFVKKEDILGKVIFRFWPLNRMGKP